MPEKSEHARLEAFCDAVFAIAITLLILDIKVPPVSSIHSVQDLWGHLLRDWTSWFGFSLSFIIILVAWINHHNIFKIITKSSPQFTYANGFMLFTVVVIPFSTKLMSEYLASNYAQPAITVYCFSILMHNVSWIFFEWTAMRPVSLFKDRASHEMFAKIIYRSSRIAFYFYLLLCVMSLWFPYPAMLLMTISWVYWIFTAVLVK